MLGSGVLKEANNSMREHHQRVIKRLVDKFYDDPRYLGLIVGGSVAKGCAADDSDVDIILVACDSEYHKRYQSGDLLYFDDTLCDYPGGYVDGKVVDLQYLKDVADHGSEPARAAFDGAFLAYSHVDKLADILKHIPVYPEYDREAKLKAFYSQVLLLNWYVGEAERRHDNYLMTHASGELALFGMRLVLAYNRILYPYHKWVARAVECAEKKPEGFLELMNMMLEQPCKATAQAFTDSLTNFRDWGVSHPQAVVNFMQDREWNWRSGQPPLQDW